MPHASLLSAGFIPAGQAKMPAVRLSRFLRRSRSCFDAVHFHAGVLFQGYPENTGARIPESGPEVTDYGGRFLFFDLFRVSPA
jgi:hypothetical protein